MLEDLILQIVLSIHSEKILRRSIHLLLRCDCYLQKFIQFVMIQNIIEHIYKFIPLSRKEIADKLLRIGKNWYLQLIGPWLFSGRGTRRRNGKGRGGKLVIVSNQFMATFCTTFWNGSVVFLWNTVSPRSIISSYRYRTCPGAATLMPDCTILAVYIFISFRNLSLSLCCSWK